MRWILFAFVAVIACSFTLIAQKGPTNKQSGIVSELKQLEINIGKANIRRDKAFFQRVEADEFVFIDSAGGVTTKAEDVASLDQPPGEFRLVSYDVDEVKVKVYGSTAVVTGRTTTVSKGREREITNRTRFTDVFVRRGGRWQLVAGHSSQIQGPLK